MTKRPRKRRRRAFEMTGRVPNGSSPHAAPPPGPAPVINLIAYGPGGTVEKSGISPSEIPAHLAKHAVTWIDVAGLGDGRLVQELGDVFGLHKLAVEDTVNLRQRPKLEVYGDHIYLVLRMVDLVETLETEQVSLFMGRNFVVTFQEDRPGDCFEGVRARLRAGSPTLCGGGPDRLVYRLVDSLLDAQYPILDRIGERMEDVEAEALARPSPALTEKIQDIRRDLHVMRRIAWPTRDAIGALARDPLPHVTEETRLYFRDCQDHAVQLLDLVESARELASGLMEIYLSSASNRMNEIMKVLTIISTIFIPLSFVAGVYGMNFDPDASPWNMPELRWRHGYPLALGLMAIMASGFVVYFARKGWLTSAPKPPKRLDDTKP